MVPYCVENLKQQARHSTQKNKQTNNNSSMAAIFTKETVSDLEDQPVPSKPKNHSGWSLALGGMRLLIYAVVGLIKSP